MTPCSGLLYHLFDHEPALLGHGDDDDVHCGVPQSHTAAPHPVGTLLTVIELPVMVCNGMSRKARICMSGDRSMGGVMMSRAGEHGWSDDEQAGEQAWVLGQMADNHMGADGEGAEEGHEDIVQDDSPGATKFRRWIGRQGSRHGIGANNGC